MSIVAERYHDISCGHRVVGHEGKCRFFHGHNYRIHFKVAATHLDIVGRVLDFSVIKEKLCMWVEENWDHHFLVWSGDPQCLALCELDPTVVVVPFNPTAENMAEYLLHYVGPQQLKNLDCRLIEVRVEETRKCSAIADLVQRLY